MHFNSSWFVILCCAAVYLWRNSHCRQHYISTQQHVPSSHPWHLLNSYHNFPEGFSSLSVIIVLFIRQVNKIMLIYVVFVLFLWFLFLWFFSVVFFCIFFCVFFLWFLFTNFYIVFIFMDFISITFIFIPLSEECSLYINSKILDIFLHKSLDLQQLNISINRKSFSAAWTYPFINTIINFTQEQTDYYENRPS